jgi:hypothetical protein
MVKRKVSLGYALISARLDKNYVKRVKKIMRTGGWD